ncbi:MAG TPA: hypothetical protein VF362_03090 [Demequinaceae bacterium]
MIQRIVLGILGGALIVLSVFTVGNSVAFDKGVPDSGAAWVVLSAGALVALFAIVGVRTLIGFGAGAAAAVAATDIIDAVRAGDFTVTARLVVLVVGVLAALAATTGRRSKRVVVEPAPAEVAPVDPNPVAGKSVTTVVPAQPAKATVTTVSAEHATTSEKTIPKSARKVRATPQVHRPDGDAVGTSE